MKITTSYKFIILDFDGTICNLSVDWTSLKNELILEFDDKYHFPNKKLMSMFNFINDNDDRSRALSIIEKYEIPDGKVNYSEFNYQLMNEASEFIVISNNLTSTINQVLTLEDQINKVKIIYGIDKVTQSKPSKEMFDEVLKYCQDADLKNYLYIGDSEVDKQFAHNCGIDFININNLYGQ